MLSQPVPDRVIQLAERFECNRDEYQEAAIKRQIAATDRQIDASMYGS